ncbi:MAG: FtsX-like permease family protein, partial [Bifidobacteriaceae bacterium]|jgi:putative ABC transport system permease protein|nr:FtsX-like permease family protein [Bifidobacteriaceae bacterium]
LAAVAIGATTLFALATIATDIPRQMTREMRAYGGNLLVLPAEGLEAIPAAVVAEVDAVVGLGDLVGSAPYRYQTVRLNEQPYLAAGTDLAAVRAVSPYWYVDGEWPSAPGEILVGQDIADWIGLEVGAEVELVTAAPAGGGEGATAAADNANSTASDNGGEGATATADNANSTAAGNGGEGAEVLAEELSGVFTVAGVTTTGGEEDSMVFLSLADLEAFTQVSGVLDAVEYSVALNGGEIDALAEAISAQVGQVSAAGVKRLTRSDSYVLDMLRSLLGLVALIVLALTMIGVSTTMMAVVAERRNEIALLKALGASNRAVEREFLTEGLTLGLAGGALGCALGYGFAQWVSLTVFHRSVGFNWGLAAAAVALSTAVAYAASLAPVRRTATVDPALVLRGE